MLKHGMRLSPHGGGLVVKSHWFNCNDGKNLAVAVVLVRFSNHGVCGFIGYGKDHQGERAKESRIVDEAYIAQWGTKVSKKMAEAIFGQIPDWEDFND